MKSGLPIAFLRRAVLAALFSASSLALAATAAVAPPAATAFKLSDAIPVGPQVMLGKLANGLTYYVQKNARPENRLELRLVVKAGSMQEYDDQQGLAHFLEHMAFNGSTHFKRNELVSYLQSVGVKFGADLNASTSFNETIYILPLPTDKPEVVAQGFQVLEDWAHGLSLNDADIDSERGIVLEELRIGKGVDDRVNKVLLPKLFNGSQYARRLPIGQEAVLKTFKYEAIRRFYRDWYRPDLMAVVVVGDIEPARARALIEQHFGTMKNPPHARPHQYAKIPARTKPEEVVYTDKEIANNSVFIRYPVIPAPEGRTVGDYRNKLLENMVTTLLNMRLYELSQQAKPPYLQAGAGMNGIVHGYRSFSAGALLGKDGVAPAIQALLQESQRARQFGFSEAELERAKKGMLRNYERMYNEREKSDSANYAAELIRNFLEQETIPGIEAEYRYAQALIPEMTLAELNAAARAQLPDGGSKLMVYTGSAGSAAPQAGEMLALASAAEQRSVVAQQEKTVARQLMDKMRAIKGVADLEYSQEGANPSTMIKINQELASDLGLSVQQIGAALRPFVAGEKVSHWLAADGQNYEVNVQLPKSGRQRVMDLADLSIAQRQMVEICKALMQDAQVIAFDEPTSSLSHRESEVLFRLVRELREAGRTIIYISHRLEELYALCDTCTIFRDGRKIVTHPVMAEVPRERLIADMVGRQVNDIYDYRTRPAHGERLSVRGLDGAALDGPASFSVRGGEALGP
eukprot:gene14700-14496_t